MSAPGPAGERILRVMSAAIGAGAIVFGALAWRGITIQQDELLAVWQAAAITVTLVLPAAAGVASLVLPVRAIRAQLSVVAVGQLLALATLVPAFAVDHVAADAPAPWILGTVAVGTTAAAVVWRGPAVWAYLVVTSALIGFDRWATAAAPGVLLHGAQDAGYSLMFNSVLGALALATVGAARRLDVASAEAEAVALQTAASLGESIARTRMTAVMHDGVLATLLTASREGGDFSAAAARQARRTLAQLAGGTPPGEGAPTARGVVWGIQAAVTDIDPAARFDSEFESGDDETRAVPAEVAEALEYATAEALRNSVGHADAPDRRANRAVHVGVRADRITVTVIDDGVGFDTRSVPSTRLGVRVSIRERMQLVDGGSAIVHSEPGTGTRVVLSWRG